MADLVENRVKFLLERLLLRGAHYRLLIIAALIGLLSVLGGALVHGIAGGFDGLADAVWWAFLRLSDPGYLGDDEGTVRRVVSTVLTVLGYVVFLGALVAIMTQWLNQTMRRLESGLTPIAVSGHYLVLGWTSRTPAVVHELLQSGGARGRRFLRRGRRRTAPVVILAEEVSAALGQELRDRLGSLWSERRILLRSGTPLRIEHLQRVAFRGAAAILIPAPDPESGQAEPDVRTVKTLLTIGQAAPQPGRAPPLVVAELTDGEKLDVARGAYPGPIEVLAGDAIVARLIAQNVRHHGLSHVYRELLSRGRGNEFYIRDAAAFTGARVQDLGPVFPHAIVLGVVRGDGDALRPLLNPPDGTTLAAGDRLVLLARNEAHTAPAPGAAPAALPRARAAVRPHVDGRTLRVLVLGWSGKAATLLREFDGYAAESFAVDVLSRVPAAQRDAELARRDVQLSRVRLRQLEGEVTAPADLRRAAPAAYDAIVLLGSDRLDSGEDADARTIVTYLLLRDMLGDAASPHVILELLDPGNAVLFRRRRGEVLVSPLVLSHMLAQVVLRHELRAVFDELFGPAGAEIVFQPAGLYAPADADVAFPDVQRAAADRGETALGVRLADRAPSATGGLLLNPPRSQRWRPGPGDEVVVLTTHGRGA